MEKNLFELELLIAKILRYGVLIAGFFIFIGWMSQIRLAGNPFLEFEHYRAEPLVALIPKLRSNSEWGLLTSYFGLILLIALPFLRVLMTAFLFVKQREYLLAGVAGLVMFGLLLSFSLGFKL